MGIRGELFTIQIPAENRTYFFNVKENTRHAIVVFEDEMQPFLQGLDKCIEFIEKNRKEKFKAKAKKAAEFHSSKEKKQENAADKQGGKRVKRIIKKQPK